MSIVTNKIAVVSGTSGDLADITARVLANEFAQVLFLFNSTGAGCSAAGARSDREKTVLQLDTNGRPLRDWDD